MDGDVPIPFGCALQADGQQFESAHRLHREGSEKPLSTCGYDAAHGPGARGRSLPVGTLGDRGRSLLQVLCTTSHRGRTGSVKSRRSRSRSDAVGALRAFRETPTWTAPSFLEAVSSGKVESRDFKEAAPR